MSTEGQFETGHAELRAILSELTKTDLFAFTVQKYTDAGRIFHRRVHAGSRGRLRRGRRPAPCRRTLKERPDFYLAYAEFKVAARDFARIVPLYTTAANLYANYYGGIA